MYGDGWRYHLLSAIALLIVGVPLSIANALSDWSPGLVYAAVVAAGVPLFLFAVRKEFRRHPPRDRPAGR